MKKLINWDKPIFTCFTNVESDIKCFIVGETSENTMLVGIPNPDFNDQGVAIEVDHEGRSIKTGMRIVRN